MKLQELAFLIRMTMIGIWLAYTWIWYFFMGCMSNKQSIAIIYNKYVGIDSLLLITSQQTLPTNLFIWPHLFVLVKVTCIAISGVLTKVVSPDLHQAGGPSSWQSTTASSSAPFNVTLPVGLLLFTWRSRARKAALLSWRNIGVATTGKKRIPWKTHT